MQVERDPGYYFPSDHAVNRAKERGIDWPLVASTIKDGEVVESHKDGCYLFIEEFEFVDDPVGVVAAESGKILTVEWRE